MTRPLDEANRAQLLDLVLEDALANGIGSLSLRPLAERIGVSAGTLLYNFTSKEHLTLAVLARAGERQRALFETIRSKKGSTPSQTCGAIWRTLSAPPNVPLFRLFFEAYGLALQDPERFPDFFRAAVERWLDFIATPLQRAGVGKREARIRATFTLACFRGFLLDLCATEDYSRVNAAVRIWLHTLNESVPFRQGSAPHPGKNTA